MSLAFSRRSFLKYSAVAAVAVAGASLFSGCEPQGDSYNFLQEGAGSMTILQVTATMGTYNETDKKYVAPEVTTSTTEITFPFKVENGRNNPIAINPNSFKVTVASKDGKTVKKYPDFHLSCHDNLHPTARHRHALTLMPAPRCSIHSS